jgi:hypothetical protein
VRVSGGSEGVDVGDAPGVLNAWVQAYRSAWAGVLTLPAAGVPALRSAAPRALHRVHGRGCLRHREEGMSKDKPTSKPPCSRCGHAHSVGILHETRGGVLVPVEARATSLQKEALARLTGIKPGDLNAVDLSKREAGEWIAAKQPPRGPTFGEKLVAITDRWDDTRRRHHYATADRETSLIRAVRLVCALARRRAAVQADERGQADARQAAISTLREVVTVLRDLPEQTTEVVPPWVSPEGEVIQGAEIVVPAAFDWPTEIADGIEDKLRGVYHPPATTTKRGPRSHGIAEARAFLQSKGITKTKEQDRYLLKAGVLRRR